MSRSPETYFWILVALRVIGAVVSIALIGKERPARTPADAVAGLVANAIVVAFAAWMLL